MGSIDRPDAAPIPDQPKLLTHKCCLPHPTPDLRKVTRSEEAQLGLETGDVVMLLKQVGRGGQSEWPLLRQI